MSDQSELLPSLRLLSRVAKAIPLHEYGFVVAGGIVPLLYREREEARPPSTPVLGTLDADIVAPRRLGRPWPDPRIPERLAACGIAKVEVPGFGREPATEYFQDEQRGTVHLAREHVEFLTWKKGGEESGRDLTGGIRVQTLQYLDLLAFEPLPFDLMTVRALELEVPTLVLLPEPAMFILQKVLCRKERDQAKRPKDLAYIYEVAVTTSADRYRDRAREVVARAMAESDEWRKWLDRGLRGLDELFVTGTATGPLEVREVLGGAMPAGAVPSGAAISAVVRAWVAGVRGV